MAPLSNTTNWLKGLPNKLSLLRIAAVPVLLLLYPIAPSLGILCGFIFAMAAITDVVDGYVARRYGMVSPLGALLDQVADKTLVAAALVLLANAGILPSFIAALLICRDIAVNGVRLMALERQVVIEVSDFGKLKTVLLSIGITCLLINRPLFDLPLREIGMICMWLGLALSIYSGWAYSHAFLTNTKNIDKT